MGLKNKLNEKVFMNYMNNTPTKFKCQGGDIFMNKNTVKNILVLIKHLTQDLDCMMLFVGREGSGKSKFMRQIAYVFWFFMKELGMIEYDYGLQLVHFGIEEMQADRLDYDLKKQQKFRLSLLDESKDDLGKDKHNNPETKAFLDYIRRCRDECGIIMMAQPQISEFLPSLVSSRASLIFSIDYDLDQETGDILRGTYKVITIPRGKKSFSKHKRGVLYREKIKVKLGEYLHDPKKRYADLPQEIVSYEGQFNNIDPLDYKAYLRKKKDKKWERQFKKEQVLSEYKRDIKHLRKVKEYFLGLLRLLKYYKVTTKAIADAMRVHTRTVDTYLRESKDVDSEIRK